MTLLLATSAFARPGGGSSYSGGSSSSSSHGGGGGGGGDAGFVVDLIEILVWLCIEHPAVGIPLTLLVIGGFVMKARLSSGQRDWSTGEGARSERSYSPPAPPPRARAAPSLDAIRAVDPTFSRVVFEDFLYSLYAEVQRARGERALDKLSAYLSPAVVATLARDTHGAVTNVIVGALHVRDVSASPAGTRVEVELESNYTEAGRGAYVVERWILARGPGARSRDPQRVRVLGCPGCGAPQEALFGGSCRHCGRVVNDGSFDWVVQSIHVVTKEPRAPMLTANVEERGTNLPTIVDPSLDRALSGLRAKDPAFDPGQVQQRLALIFDQFQAAWSSRDLARMRPFLSDALFSTQEYYVAAYLAQQLRNVTERTRITNVQFAKVTSDAYYDALTVRLWATGLDYTIRDDGKLVSGSRSRERAYSEYWTLIRGTNRKGPARTDLACANCGAPLDVNMAGHCKYCQVKVTTGDFDWVLSRIEQDESYAG